MNNHDDIREKLSAYCCGDLAPKDRTLLEDHLAGCASCRADLDDLRIALRLVRTTPESEPPPWLAARIMARVREQQQRESRSWLQRIFFPLHVKLPIEVAALLLVCVSGYYLARNVETGMNQPAAERSLPATTPETAAPAGAVKGEGPAAVPAGPVPQLPAARKEHQPEGSAPVQPAASQSVEETAPQRVPAAPGKPSPQPAFAPAPPLVKEERRAPAVEAPAATDKSFEKTRGFAPAATDIPAAAETKKKALRKDERNLPATEAVRPAPGAPAGAAPAEVRIRLRMTAPASAPGTIREALVRSGGTVVEDDTLPPEIIRARLPSGRMDELLERLGRLGTVLDQPRTRDLPEVVEIKISW